MNERARQQYLSALGIDSFVPRVILPWAPQPRLCPLPEIIEEAHTANRPRLSDTPLDNAPAKRHVKAAGASASVGDVLGDMGIPASSKPVRKVPVSLAAPKARQGVTPLHLHVWRTESNLLILDEHKPGSALPTETLLFNILLACRSQQKPLGAAERMRCPLNDQLAQIYSHADLREELQAWLAEALAQQPETELWLMGGELARCFIPPDNNPLEVRFTWPQLSLSAHSPAVKALIAPSLTDMLEQPALKRPMWKALNGL